MVERKMKRREVGEGNDPSPCLFIGWFPVDTCNPPEANDRRDT